MATKDQHDIYRAAYDEELTRCSDLRNTGKIYLSICSFFLGGLAFKLNEVFEAASPDVRQIYLAAILVLGLAFVAVLAALGAYRYEALFRPLTEIERFEQLSDSDFFDRRIVDVAKAYDINFKANNRRGRWLQISTALIVAGIILAIVSLASVAYEGSRA